MIFNGDTVEQKFEDSPAHIEHPLPSIGRLKDKIESLGSKATFLTGNHDPEVSKAHYCAIDNGSVLITHFYDAGADAHIYVNNEINDLGTF